MAKGKDINLAARLLRAGEIVAIPTETVYGLAANALNAEAVVKIFEAKQRPRFNPLIVHFGNVAQMQKYILDIPENAALLAGAFWPGPLTLLLPKKPAIGDLVTSGSSRVAVRIPNHPLTLELLSLLDFPLAAPSANRFGYISPTTAAHVERQFRTGISYILDGGPSTIGLESTIVGFEGELPIIYRQGGISMEALEACVGEVVLLNHSEKPQASGMLKSHYAPKTPLYLGDPDILLKEYPAGKVGVLSFSRFRPGISPDFQVVLSRSGDLHEAAKNLFAALHYLDSLGLDRIIAEQVPDTGIGRAINDRLERARQENKVKD
ncbi:MAG: L-threonylcarbamoyladenylate synthase [Bacteroidia bacterium]|nr:L-threonylcarbamoyladenylate synthase [Bacteroidia bacterium]